MNLLGNTLGDDEIYSDAIPRKSTIVPPCWHHVYFPPRTLESDLAPDGYESEFFPPEPFSQRMWVGAKMDWNPKNPLRVGDEAHMTTALDRAELREGRMGESAMVWINKDISNQLGWSMREQRCLVYHPKQTTTNASRGIKVKKDPDFQRQITPSSIFLFRYSALTFNSHKIHFDHEYATKIEKHPGCLVHGPLSGTLLIDLLRKQVPQAFIHSFEYKCLTPLYVNQPMILMGKKSANGYELWIKDHLGNLAVKGSASIST
ncbi:acyl-CoA dehydrogenase [Mucor ambiguus]|uniref:Acyl-CoA dehydrogenase n=1 Tax=Mucor ambiguus TaxID=91626 RepID=A0A0C9MPU8_9FUNG|nr:acyl-CoA dehydrogenase [Mucor ambiguus]